MTLITDNGDVIHNVPNQIFTRKHFCDKDWMLLYDLRTKSFINLPFIGHMWVGYINFNYLELLKKLQ